MLILGHIGPTVALAHWYLKQPKNQRRYLQQWDLSTIDWRVIFAAGIVCDLVDKPIALFFVPQLGTTRHVFHTLAITLLAFLLTLIFSKSRTHTHKIKAYLPFIAMGMALHLLLDWIDKPQPKTLFFPLLGWEFERVSPLSLQLNDYLKSIVLRMRERPMIPIFEFLGWYWLRPYWRWVKALDPQQSSRQKLKCFLKSGRWV